MNVKYKNLLKIFILAFVLNSVWEVFHSVLYIHYQSAPITLLILLRAAVVDAGIITVLYWTSDTFRLSKSFVLVVGGLIVAIAIELWALETGRWEYTQLMPIVPILNVGLTPMIQLALTGYVSQKIVAKYFG